MLKSKALNLQHYIRSGKFKEIVNGYIFLLPMLLVLFVLILYPMLATYRYTLYDWTGLTEPDRYVGFGNFIKVAQDPYFWNAVKNSAIYTAVLVPIQLSMALILAICLNSLGQRRATLARTMFFIPVVTTPAIVGTVFWMILNPINGPLNIILRNFGLVNGYVDWLGDPKTALAAIIGVGIWQGLGINIIYFLAGLQSIPRYIYEAAIIDGANSIQKLVFITLPLLKPVAAIILLLATLGSLQVFDTVQVMTGGGPSFSTDVIQTYIFRYAFGGERTQPAVGYASAAALFMGVLTMVFAIAQMLVARRSRQQD